MYVLTMFEEKKLLFEQPSFRENTADYTYFSCVMIVSLSEMRAVMEIVV